jgi:ubiquinone/menaquinone biosynthesis C-methylase UbiE
MIEWLHLMLSQQHKNDKSMAILDVGTGNALLPLQLAKLGYSNLTGSDYSAQSIALSQHILQKHGQAHIKLLVCVLCKSGKTAHKVIGSHDQSCITRRKMICCRLV